MKEFKGTKGKWELHPHAVACVCLKDGRVIANCGSYCNNIEFERIAAENEANAKLITAAHELLEALIKMCEYHEKNASWDKCDNGYYKAKQAINKALK